MLDIRSFGCIYSLSLLKELSDLLVEWLYRTFTGFNRCNMLAASRGLAHAAKILLRHPGLDFISATLLGCFHAFAPAIPNSEFQIELQKNSLVNRQGCTFLRQTFLRQTLHLLRARSWTSVAAGPGWFNEDLRDSFVRNNQTLTIEYRPLKTYHISQIVSEHFICDNWKFHILPLNSALFVVCLHIAWFAIPKFWVVK